MFMKETDVARLIVTGIVVNLVIEERRFRMKMGNLWMKIL
jgi:hypothetical protein